MDGYKTIQDTKGLLENLQHDRLTIKVSDSLCHLPSGILNKLLQPHRMAYYFFLYVDKGFATHQVDIQNYTVSGGQLLFVLPNQVHQILPAEECLQSFHLGFDEVCLSLLPKTFPFLSNPLNTPVLSFDEDTQQRISTLFILLHQVLRAGKATNNAEIILAYLNTLLVEINQVYFRQGAHENLAHLQLSTFIAFKAAIETCLTEQPSVRQLARNLSVSPNNLYNSVKAFSGLSPKSFIQNRLMLEARRKLYYEQHSVKELAYELGFNDPDYFSRLFRKITGRSIRNFREEVQHLSGN